MRKLLPMLLWGMQQRGIQVLLVLFLYLSIGSYLPNVAHQGLYTVSLFIKDLLVWMLPITVGFFIAHTIASFEKKAPLFIGMLLLFETLSNLTCVWYAFMGGHLAVEHLPTLQLPEMAHDFNPLWRLPIVKPSWWSADKGTFVGILLGFWVARRKTSSLKNMITKGKDGAEWILTRLFSRMIPLFVLGFVAKMQQTELLSHVFTNYGFFLLWLLVFLLFYIAFVFFLGSDFSFRGFLRSMKNLLPAGSLAFTSGCSLSTMPWTMEGAGKNLKNPDFAKAVIPATTNIQQIGDCITNAFLCFLIYTHFYGHAPSLMTWSLFSVVFVLARFATAAVIGGAIFVMLPVYESYLSFNAEMIAIILAFNVILDPIITSCNVLGNGALCRVFEKCWNALTSRNSPEEEKKEI